MIAARGSERTERGPLTGLRVVDLTSVVVGPYCTLALADMGADVIKVESPAGDTMRDIGPRRNPGMGSQFLSLNRNKRSVVLDLKKPAAREALSRLVETADVFIHNMRRPAIERLGLTYGAIAAVNERIVYCTIHGFHSAGPYRDKAAYDDTIQGASGLAAIQSRNGEPPRYVVSAIADKTPAMVALSSVLAALLYRERTGRGQELEVPMFESMTAYVMSEHLYGKTFEPPLGPTIYSRQVSPFRRPHPTADGYICALMYTDEQWDRFFRMISRAELISDPRFLTIGTRTDNIDELYSIVGEALRGRSTADWLSAFEDADIPAMPVNTPDDLLNDKHLRATDFFYLTEHPTEGTVRNVRYPASFSDTPIPLAEPAPTPGQHSHHVLAELGYGEEELKSMVAAGAINPPASNQ
ncbi:CaiB/BaiF CoA transferase family protein [Actinophytocola sp.]|uniref:CaiB/BaiF CoA transferase family protein n=1 Tax=Actinophytocola sp. TaxID=1872138 RepID=UPI003D6B299B